MRMPIKYPISREATASAIAATASAIAATASAIAATASAIAAIAFSKSTDKDYLSLLSQRSILSWVLLQSTAASQKQYN